MSYTFSPEEVKELILLIVNGHISLDFLQVQHLILVSLLDHKYSVYFEINTRFLPKFRIMKYEVLPIISINDVIISSHTALFRCWVN